MWLSNDRATANTSSVMATLRLEDASCKGSCTCSCAGERALFSTINMLILGQVPLSISCYQSTAADKRAAVTEDRRQSRSWQSCVKLLQFLPVNIKQVMHHFLQQAWSWLMFWLESQETANVSMIRCWVKLTAVNSLIDVSLYQLSLWGNTQQQHLSLQYCEWPLRKIA